jgi:hypothetical protein
MNEAHEPLVACGPRFGISVQQKYKVSIKSFPDYKHLLQEN